MMSRRSFLRASAAIAAASWLTPPLRAAAAGRAPAFEADAFVESVGTNIRHWVSDSPYRQDWDRTLQQLRRAGIRHVRQRLPRPDESWFLRAAGELGREHGIRHAFGIDVRQGHHPDVRQLDEALATARELADVTVAYVGPNEYDGRHHADEHWRQRLLEYQAALYERVHADAALRGRPVIAPPMSWPNLLRQFGPDDLGASADVANAHTYLLGLPPEGNAAIRDLLEHCGRVWPGKPIMPTEGGYHTAWAHPSGRGISLEAHGRYVPRAYLELFARGVARTYLFEFRSRREGPRSDREAHFGLIRNDGTELPAYHAVRHLNALLADPGPPHRPAALPLEIEARGDSLQHLQFRKRDGACVLVLWLGDASYRIDHPTENPADNALTVEPVDVAIRCGFDVAEAQLHRNLQAVEHQTEALPRDGRWRVRVTDAIEVITIAPAR